MEVTHGSEVPYQDANAKHRSSGIAFKFLSLGVETTKENYMFALARQSGFYSPRHKHNFDQFRFAIKGDFSLGPDLILKQGQLAYHPEGVEYGPQNDGPQEQVLLVLQFGGASGQGFLSLDQIRAANKELVKAGIFEGGKYYAGAIDGREGKRDGVGVDGYEAAWSFAMGGRKLLYPRGRYNAPIIMDPSAFAYRMVEEGVRRKLLGIFSEREVVAQTWRIDEGGVLQLGGEDEIHLVYVLSGEGQIAETAEDKSDNLHSESVVRLLPGARARVTTSELLEVLHFVMPML